MISMIKMTIKCKKCFSAHTKKNGKAPSGSQKYRCKECGYAFVEYPKKQKISEEKKALVNRLLLEKLSLAGIARSVGVSEAWLQGYVNKKYKNISKALEHPKGRFRLVLECDEMWSFCGNKKHKQWIWIALNRDTRAIVGLHIGDRSNKGAKALWNSLPASCKEYSTIYTDFWESYKAIFPEKQLTQCGKEEGHTNHVERFNNTLRQRVSRLVRQTLSFSKKLTNHVGAIWDLVHDYNKNIYEKLRTSLPQMFSLN